MISAPSPLSVDPDSRDKSLDIMKGILIILVVFGHLIEKSPQPLILTLYGMIYLFHMPAFIFLAGWFSPQQGNMQKLRILILAKTYLIWFGIYCIAVLALTGKIISPFTPYWILWFIFSLSIWTGAIFFFKRLKSPWVFPAIVTAALMAGLIDEPETGFGLQRTLYFFPFFYAGFLLQKAGVNSKNIGTKTVLAGCVTAALFLAAYIFYPSFFPVGFLYGSQSFESLGLSPLNGIILRLVLIAGGFGCIAVLFVISGHISFGYLEKIGRNSLSIYLLHGLAILSLRETGGMEFTTISSLLFVIPSTVFLCLLLGNDWLSTNLKRVGLIYKTSTKDGRGSRT